MSKEISLIVKLTPEQIVKIKKLEKNSLIKSIFMGLRAFLYLVGGDLIVAVADHFYVHSLAFVFIGSFLTAIMAFGNLRHEIIAREVEIEKEIKKILEDVSLEVL